MKDIDIARAARMQPIGSIAAKLGIGADQIEPYGHYKAKITQYLPEAGAPQAKLVLVSAISPTPAGEGKTTCTIGINDGLNRIGKRSIAVIREPSLGPVFGMKGGAAGGGYSQVVPMEDINLHFTGDFHAVTAANNLLAAIIDNKLQSKKDTSNLDGRTIRWKRVLDLNDRSLRDVVIGLGGKGNGVPRETGFNITAASEIMAILCLSRDFEDLQQRINRIYIGDRRDGTPVFAEELGVTGALSVLLKDAIKPNLVQSLENNPVLIHGGPFANIAQGTNSMIATRFAMSKADVVVTEAGFGADLGGEKFFNIKGRHGGFAPDLVVLVATIRGLKYQGGVGLKELTAPDPDAVTRGFVNLRRHIENVRSFGREAVVIVNRFATDSAEEHQRLVALCAEMNCTAVVSNPWGEGGKGCEEIATVIAEKIQAPMPPVRLTYEREDSYQLKMEKIAKTIYRASAVKLSAEAAQEIRRAERIGLSDLLVCMAKNQYSFSDQPDMLGAPEGHVLNVRSVEICAGAGFIVPIAGAIIRMPGLPDVPAAEGMGIDAEGNVFGLS